MEHQLQIRELNGVIVTVPRNTIKTKKYKKLQAYTFCNVQKMNKFLERQNLPC